LRAARAAGYLLAAVIVGLAWQLASWASGNLIPGPAPAMAYLAEATQGQPWAQWR